MLAEVWKARQETQGPYSYPPIEPTAGEHLQGVAWMPCDWCEGAGLFELPDGRLVDCNTCKTSGRIPVMA
jgi:hypothetical protein